MEFVQDVLPTSTVNRIVRQKHTAVHEVIKSHYVKLFCDVDCNLTPEYTIETAERDVQIIEAEMKAKFGFAAYKASYQTATRYSLHLVCPIKVHIEYQKQFFTQLSESLVNKDIIDTSVYGLNKSLRLPLCPKVDSENIYTDRILRFDNDIKL